jgi:hypothetical protein
MYDLLLTGGIAVDSSTGLKGEVPQVGWSDDAGDV